MRKSDIISVLFSMAKLTLKFMLMGAYVFFKATEKLSKILAKICERFMK